MILDAEENINGAWEDDLLGRKEVSEKFTNLLHNVSPDKTFVISINSPYGTGKTYFLKNWYQSLDRDKFVPVFYNAWQTDFYEHALISFTFSLLQEFKEKKLVNGDGSLLTKLENVTVEIVKSAALNSLSLGVLKREDLDKAINHFQDLDGHKCFDEYNTRVKNLREFKKVLAEVVHQLRLNEQKLVIFVDELERCRPTFAVELLECIKHLFDVEGILFVLATDKAQLKHTISNLYGQAMDSEGYLKRFIDLELTLPTVSRKDYVVYLYKFHKLNEFLPENENVFNGGQLLVEYIVFCSDLLHLSLRDVEQCFTDLNAVIRMIGNNFSFYPVLFSLFISLKHKYPKKYEEIGTFDDVEQEIGHLIKLLNFKYLDAYLPNIEYLKIHIYVGMCTTDNDLMTDISSSGEPAILTKYRGAPYNIDSSQAIMLYRKIRRFSCPDENIISKTKKILSYTL